MNLRGIYPFKLHFVKVDHFVSLASIGFIKMAESKSGLRKPVFTKVDQLRPGTSGHTLTVKVVSAKMVLQKGRPDGPQIRQMRIAECLVGDETGMIIFTARNDQGTFCSVSNCLLRFVQISNEIYVNGNYDI